MSDIPPTESNEQEGKGAKRPRLNVGWGMLFLLVTAIACLLYINWTQMPSTISLSYLENLIQGKDFDGNPIRDKEGKPVGPNIERLQIVGEQAYGVFKEIPPPEPTVDSQGNLIPGTRQLKKQFSVQIPNPNSQAGAALYDRLRAQNITVEKEQQADFNLTSILVLAMLFALPILIMFYLLRRMQNQVVGGGNFLSNFSRSPARRFEPSEKRVTFGDVAGLDSVKGDLFEIVEYLRDPKRFQRLGGQIPKGVLLFGPPGTGKTLMARAVAGEAGVPFFSVNGSEFIQMFVGVGASRVRDMFRTAKENSPCILFIDEIDAVGRIRGAGLGGGHDEREQTLNQILSEMDGFQQTEAVIVVAATNRPDVLDPALLRPGRFDRHVTVDRPNKTGREAILKVHCRKVPLADNVNLADVASGTIGFSGAELKNLVNEAALNAARMGRDAVTPADFDDARDKVLMGPEREDVLNEKEKEMTAYHEAGHALLAWLLSDVDRVHKVTIIPRGRALGVTQLLPAEDRYNIGEHRLHSQLAFMLGGRAAEKLVFNEYSAGASDDLKRATQLARSMVAKWGMSELIGPVAFRDSEEHPFLGKEIHEARQHSEETARQIDVEIQRFLREADVKATETLQAHRDKLDGLTKALIEKESLGEDEIRAIIGNQADRSASVPDKSPDA